MYVAGHCPAGSLMVAIHNIGNDQTTYYELTSIYGHDTFMLDVRNVGMAIKVQIAGCVCNMQFQYSHQQVHVCKLPPCTHTHTCRAIWSLSSIITESSINLDTLSTCGV